MLNEQDDCVNGAVENVATEEHEARAAAATRTGQTLPWGAGTLSTAPDELIDLATGQHRRWSLDDYFAITLRSAGAEVWAGRTVDEAELKRRGRDRRSEPPPTLPGAFVLVNHVAPGVRDRLSFNEWKLGAEATRKRSVYRLAGNWVEQDQGSQAEQAKRIVDGFGRLGLLPSVINHSGKKSLHLQVLYDAPLELTPSNLRRWGYAQAILAQLVQGDPAVALRLAHRMRLPGYVPGPDEPARHQPILWLSTRVDPEAFLRAAEAVELTDEILVRRYEAFRRRECGDRPTRARRVKEVTLARLEVAVTEEPAATRPSREERLGEASRESSYGGQLSLDEVVRIAGGGEAVIRDLRIGEGERLIVHCPHHVDDTPSAFLGRGRRVGVYLSCPQVCGRTWHERPRFADAFPHGLDLTGFEQSGPARGAVGESASSLYNDAAEHDPPGQPQPQPNPGIRVPLDQAERVLGILADQARVRSGDIARTWREGEDLRERYAAALATLKVEHGRVLEQLQTEAAALANANLDARLEFGDRSARLVGDQEEEIRSVEAEYRRTQEEHERELAEPARCSGVGDAQLPRRVIHQRFLEPLELQPGTTYVVSEKFTGKTTALAQAVAEAKSVLIVCPRVSLARAYAAKFGVAFYKDVKERIIEEQKISVCLDSIGRIKAFNDGCGIITLARWRKFDLVVLDESELLLRHFFAGTLGERAGQAYVTLRTLVANAGRVVCLDADLSDLTVSAVRAMTGARPEILVENLSVPEPSRFLLFEEKAELIDRCLALVRAGKRLYVASNSRTLTEALRLQLERDALLIDKEVAVRVYNSDTTEELQHEVGNLTEAVQAFDVVLASPSLTSGVSIDCEHFDQVVLFAEPGPLPATDLLQLVARVRRPKSPTILAWVAETHFDFEAEPAKIERDFATRVDWTDAEVGYRYTKDEQGRPRREAFDGDFLRLYCSVRSLERRATNLQHAAFIEALNARGIPYVYGVPVGEDCGAGVAAVAEGYQEAREAVLEARAERIASAKTITIEEAQAILCRRSTTPEKLAAKKAVIAHFYGVPASVELVKLDDEGRYRERVRNYAAYRLASEGHIEVLRDRDLVSYLHGLRPLLRMDTHRGVLIDRILRSFRIDVPLRQWVNRVGVHTAKGGIRVLSGIHNDVLDQTAAVRQWRGSRRKMQEVLGPLRNDPRESPIGFLKEVLGAMDVALSEPEEIEQSDGSTVDAYELNRESLERMEELSRALYERCVAAVRGRVPGDVSLGG